MTTLEAGRRAVALFGEIAMTTVGEDCVAPTFRRVGFRDEQGHMIECGGGHSWEEALSEAERARGSWEPLWQEVQGHAAEGKRARPAAPGAELRARP